MQYKYLLALAILTTVMCNATAQGKQANRNGYCPKNGSGTYCLTDELNEEQQKQLQTERVRFKKEIQDDKNRLNELRARKRTVMTTEPINRKSLDEVLMEINNIEAAIEKKRFRHQQVVKSFLNDQQIIEFDARRTKQAYHMNGNHKGRKYAGYGNCETPMCQGQRRGDEQRKGIQANYGGRQGNRSGHQRHMQRGMMPEELQATMKQSHLNIMKEQQPLNNELNELRAQLQTLSTGKTYDVKKLDRLIDRQSEIKLQIAKLHADKMLEIRSQLNDEQKLWFDNHHQKRRPYRQL